MLRWLLLLVILGGCAAGEVDDPADATVGATPSDCPRDADCTGRVCGLDPVCGLSCGTCPDEGICTDGRCGCTPDCDGRTCRPDGCGGICAGCPAGEACQNGACVPAMACPAAADCAGRTCGPDPVCQTDCGACLDGQICTADGLCAAAPPGCPEIADCADRVCGPDPVCGTACGACEAGDCLDGQCVIDACGARACGPDGMGGTCGDCPAGQRCEAGACVCAPNCDGRVCGDDGCGGTCGACPAGVACEAGVCACDPRWSAPIAGLGRLVVEVGPYVVALGQAEGGAYAWVFDLCGAPVNDGPVALPDAGTSTLTVGHAIDDDIIVGGPLDIGQGDAAFNAAVTRLSLPDLTPRWATTIAGAARTTLLDLARDAQGELWLTGAEGIYPAQTARLSLLGADGRTCRWPPFASESSATHEVTTSADGRTVYVSVVDAPAVGIDRYSADCLLADQCACVPDGRVEIQGVPAGALTAISGLEVRGDVAWLTVYWFVENFGEMRAEVRRVPLDGGDATAFEWNPTPSFDFLYDLVLVPGGVRVAAANGFAIMGQPPPDAIILAFEDVAADPVEHIVGPGLLVDLAPGRGALYTLRTVDQQSVLHRCDESGACAP